jgi:hypothetical protein
MTTSPSQAMSAANLHAAIMNIPCAPKVPAEFDIRSYAMGHRDARHASADLVTLSQQAPSGQQAEPTMVAIAKRNFRQAALNCVEVLEQALSIAKAVLASQAERPAVQQAAATEPKDEQEIMFMVYDYAKISDGIDSAEGDARRQQLEAMREKAQAIRAAIAATLKEAT